MVGFGTGSVSAASNAGTDSAAEVASQGSCPAIARSNVAASETVRASGPIWSSDDANASSP